MASLLYGAKTQVAHFLRVLTPPWVVDTLISLTQRGRSKSEGLSDSSRGSGLQNRKVIKRRPKNKNK